MNKEQGNFLPKDISQLPLVRVIGNGKFCVFQVRLEDGRIATYSMPINNKKADK